MDFVLPIIPSTAYIHFSIKFWIIGKLKRLECILVGLVGQAGQGSRHLHVARGDRAPRVNLCLPADRGHRPGPGLPSLL